MATPLCLSDAQRVELSKAFQEYLAGFVPKTNIFDFKANILAKDVAAEKMSIYFSPIAKLKMETLVETLTTEVGWHGIVNRVDKTHFIIEDIIVYPQTVTGANVTTDDEIYANFLMSQPDEIFDNLRFQGHSHVNFGVTPSAVDENFYSKILNQIKDNDYYIFMILNKRGEYMIRVYDLETQLVYNTKDCLIETLLSDSTGLTGWLTESKKLIETKTYTNTTTYTTPATTRGGFDPNDLDDTGYAGYHSYGGYTGYTGSEMQHVANGKVTPLNSDVPKTKKEKAAEARENRRNKCYGSY